MPRVLALSGSLRTGSHSTSLLRHAAARAGDDLELILYEGLREIRPSMRTPRETRRTSRPSSG